MAPGAGTGGLPDGETRVRTRALRRAPPPRWRSPSWRRCPATCTGTSRCCPSRTRRCCCGCASGSRGRADPPAPAGWVAAPPVRRHGPLVRPLSRPRLHETRHETNCSRSCRSVVMATSRARDGAVKAGTELRHGLVGISQPSPRQSSGRRERAQGLGRTRAGCRKGIVKRHAPRGDRPARVTRWPSTRGRPRWRAHGQPRCRRRGPTPRRPPPTAAAP